MRTARSTRVIVLSAMLCCLFGLASCGDDEQSEQIPLVVQIAQSGSIASSSTPLPPTATQTATPMPSPTVTPDLRPPLSRTRNLLILGSDRRPRMPNWLTDVMIIVTLDFENQRAGVISIPRDVFLEEIPNHQPNKINVVDYLGEKDEPGGGGPKLMGQMVEKYMGIPIHHYLRFDFNSFRDVVDALGGVEIDVPCAYSDWVYIDNAAEAVRLNVQPGHYRMDGDTALAYVRSRRTRGDLDRTQRQQEFIWAVRTQIMNENVLPRIPALYTALDDAVQTDIDVVTAIRLVRFALSLDESDIHRFVLGPPDLLRSGWRLNMSVFVADWPAITEAVQHIFEQSTIGLSNPSEDPGRCG